jgi:hypothetical protein
MGSRKFERRLSDTVERCRGAASRPHSSVCTPEDLREGLGARPESLREVLERRPEDVAGACVREKKGGVE